MSATTVCSYRAISTCHHIFRLSILERRNTSITRTWRGPSGLPGRSQVRRKRFPQFARQRPAHFQRDAPISAPADRRSMPCRGEILHCPSW